LKLLVASFLIQLSLHQFKEALETGKEVVKINARGAAVYGVLCDAYGVRAIHKEAIKWLIRWCSSGFKVHSGYLRLCSEIHGDLPGAIEAMKLA